MQKIGETFYPDTEHLKHVERWNQLREFLPVAYEWVEKWGSCIDGGAFAGVWSRSYAQRFDRVYAFEPVPENVECVRLNTPPNVSIIPCALSQHPGFKRFRLKGGNFAHLGDGEELVWGTTIDSFSYSDLGLIKLDVEGQEVATLEGATRTIALHRPVICVEIKYEGEEIRTWLRANAYSRKAGNGLDEVWSPE